MEEEHSLHADAGADFRFFHCVLNRDWGATGVVVVRTLLLTPCLFGGRGCPSAGEWTLYSGQQRVCNGRAVEALCARLRAARTPLDKAVDWDDLGVVDVQACTIASYARAVVLEADGELVVENAAAEWCARIPRNEIGRWLDEWTPLWRLSQRPAVDAAEAPPDEGV